MKTVIPIGRTVLCDLCNRDWTDNPTSGGFIFETKGVCPLCADRMQIHITKHGEERFVVRRCTSGESFAEMVRDFRGPDAEIVIHSGEDQ